MATNYPIIPGHEIVGRVTRIDSAVTKYKPGDLVAVGCMIDSDRTCQIANVISNNSARTNRRKSDQTEEASCAQL